MADSMADRRGAERFPLVLLAEIIVISGDARFSARTSDLSRTGCFVDTRLSVPKGTAISITLTQQSVTLKLQATVAYVSAGFGLGIHFDDTMQPEQLAVLERWLATAA